VNFGGRPTAALEMGEFGELSLPMVAKDGPLDVRRAVDELDAFVRVRKFWALSRGSPMACDQTGCEISINFICLMPWGVCKSRRPSICAHRDRLG